MYFCVAHISCVTGCNWRLSLRAKLLSQPICVFNIIYVVTVSFCALANITPSPHKGISMGTVPLLSDPHKMWHSQKGNETEGKARLGWGKG